MTSPTLLRSMLGRIGLSRQIEVKQVSLLYRGVSEELDQENDGRLKPRGSRKEVEFRYDNSARHNGRVTYGRSEANAVEAHHTESGLYGGCFISTSRSQTMAERCARGGGSGRGWLYVIDEALLAQHGVVAHEPLVPLHPGEEEVTLRAHDGGDLPLGIVVEKRRVEPRSG